MKDGYMRGDPAARIVIQNYSLTRWKTRGESCLAISNRPSYRTQSSIVPSDCVPLEDDEQYKLYELAGISIFIKKSDMPSESSQQYGSAWPQWGSGVCQWVL
jgi:hypothetical protein